MIRIKTLSLLLISSMFFVGVQTSNSQVSFELSSEKTYRQSESRQTFRGGSFNIRMTDGSVTSIPGCDYTQYYPPGFFLLLCSPGTTAFLTSGTIDGNTIDTPYLLVTGIFPATAIAPREPARISLIAAPASELPRPLGGFKDSSSSLYYNLHINASIREYILTRYDSARNYETTENDRFNKEIVPGTYHYIFPRLGNPSAPAPVKALIYPMADALSTRNNVTSGFEYTRINNGVWDKKGFVEMSYIRPNTFNWRPFAPNNVFAGSDALYFSIRVLSKQGDPKANTDQLDDFSGKQQSVFPAFANNGDPRVLLPSPFVSNFTTPPILPGGTQGIAELQLQRNFQTGGVTYDFSARKFQIPVIVVNRYSEYEDAVFAKASPTSGLLEDTDGDGFNNLNEWILDSSASDPRSMPVAPVATDNPFEFDSDFFFFFGNTRLVRSQYYGFTINQKLGTNPRVAYTLQRSTDNGLTWGKFVSDANWIVRKVTFAAGQSSLRQNSSRRVEIRVESRYNTAGQLLLFDGGIQGPPPGTSAHLYRVKVTLAK